MSAPQVIKDLVTKFGLNIAQYKSPSYNETETRVEFLNPFWEELGWDVNNRAGYALNYRDVIHEDSIRLKNSSDSNSKAPDYAFRIGGVRKFFLEAKKPSVAIRTDASPAFQLRCYGWSCGLALSVLSDFEEFAVYNCRIRPVHTDSASVARIKYLNYTEYVDHWDEIAEIFHRENILKGSFDRFVESKKSKAGTTEVDEEFLKEIEFWRQQLANDIAKNNHDISVRDLNFAVQRTIDRILFLRMAEDRGIEPEDQLANLIKNSDIYQNLQNIYRRADDKYNSGFFHFEEETGIAEMPDALTPTLQISDRVLREIIGRQYPPQSPYRYDVMPVEMLGNVYERFLGNVIRLTPSRMAKVEEKPEVRKAGGVYYTPGYIVDYIVQNTVGKLCDGKTPKQVSALRILDPACGSGSFLLGAYKFLLDWHLRWYIAEYEKTNKIPQSPPSGKRKKKSDPNAILQTSNGSWKLTLAERKRILLNNIYGVDLDAQAVEVSKLSLSLAVLEGANQEMLDSDLRFFYDRALPNLSENIKCGNSLIASDFYNSVQMTLFDTEEQMKINAFDWSDPIHGFGAILSAGGFDAVIGNPPYTYLIDEKSQEYFSKTYKFQNYQKDLYLIFLEKYRYLLKNAGLLGVIISNTWLSSLTYQSIRRYLRSEYTWRRLLHLPEKVFEAVVDTNVLIFERTPPAADYEIPIDVYSKKKNEFSPLHTLRSSTLPVDGSPINIVSNPAKQELYNRIVAEFPALKNYTQSTVGVKPFQTGKGRPTQTQKIVTQKPFVAEGKKPNDSWTPLLRGSLIQRYVNLWNENYWIQYGPWLAEPRNPQIFEAPEKIVIRQTGDSLIATIIPAGFIARDNLYIIVGNSDLNLRYILALLNSRFMNFIYSVMNPEQGEALAQIKKKHVEQLPIRTIDFSKPSEVALHDKIVSNVTQLLELKSRNLTTPVCNPQENELILRRISSLDRQIDALVCDLYGLTDEEKMLVNNL